MLTPDALKLAIHQGIMAFPATAFDAHGALNELGTAEHVGFLASQKPTAIVAAGGAGELFSLTLSEHERVVRVAVENAGGVPVIGGVGYGTLLACDMALAVERAGADAVLLLPPYLVQTEQEGLFRHIRAVCQSVSVAVIPYSRDNAVLAPETVMRLLDACPNIIGLKDGIGDMDVIAALKYRTGDRLAIINGTPTAEVFAPQFQAVGVAAYSSAVFTFLPALAQRFYQALCACDSATRDAILLGFYDPLVKIRNRKRGYAVSIVKAGLRVVGQSAGPVRPPLVDLDAAEEEMLAQIIASAAQWKL
jgi:5-dehydro-4-deoxyglucarate dehydratase